MSFIRLSTPNDLWTSWQRSQIERTLTKANEEQIIIAEHCTVFGDQCSCENKSHPCCRDETGLPFLFTSYKNPCSPNALSLSPCFQHNRLCKDRFLRRGLTLSQQPIPPCGFEACRVVPHQPLPHRAST